jgi:hypothetical protein
MGKVRIGDSPQIIIDICTRGMGCGSMGENCSIKKSNSANNRKQSESAEQRVINFLGEVFQI